MIPFLLIFGALPALVGYLVYPRLPSRSAAGLTMLGAAAVMAGFLLATAEFWWLAQPVTSPPVWSMLMVAIGMGLIAGVLLMAGFVAVFGGAQPTEPRPLHRVIAVAVTALLGLLVCPFLVDLQAG